MIETIVYGLFGRFVFAFEQTFALWIATWMMLKSWPLTLACFLAGVFVRPLDKKLTAGGSLGVLWAILAHLIYGWAGWSPFWWMVAGGVMAGVAMAAVGHAVRTVIARLNADVGAKL